MYRMPAKDPSSFQWLGSFQAPEPWALVLATQHSSKAAFIISGSGPAVGLSHQYVVPLWPFLNKLVKYQS